jgi:hypothetical protein
MEILNRWRVAFGEAAKIARDELNAGPGAVLRFTLAKALILVAG